MSQDAKAVDIAIAFTKAWTSHEMDAAAGYLADDVVFDGPINHSTSAKAYLEGLRGFASAVTSLKVIAAAGDDTQALIMYEVTTGPFGTLTCAEHFTLRDGKIQTDRLTFDTFEVRKARPS